MPHSYNWSSSRRNRTHQSTTMDSTMSAPLSRLIILAFPLTSTERFDPDPQLFLSLTI